MSEESATERVVFKRTGELVIKDGADEIIIAHYDKVNGKLEFMTKEYSVKYYQQVTARIGTTNQGKNPSGMLIKELRVKGDAVPKKSLPPRPRFGPLGDASADIVGYYLKHDLPQAIIRYGIYTDASGQPIRRRCRRRMDTITDHRFDLDDTELVAQKDGPKTQVRGPVAIEPQMTVVESGIVARRATQLTYTPNEVIGDFAPPEDSGESVDLPSEAAIGEGAAE